jgi:hypothetical protein
MRVLVKDFAARGSVMTFAQIVQAQDFGNPVVESANVKVSLKQL